MIPAPADVAAPPAEAVTTFSGLATKVQHPGAPKGVLVFDVELIRIET